MYDLSKLTSVYRSWWTGAFYLRESESPTGEAVIETNDEPLHEQIHELIEDWLVYDDDEAGASVYRKDGV